MELAALSGCDSIKMVKGLPLARGLGLQLSFRDHPYLGLVAVYDQFVIEDDKSVILRKIVLFSVSLCAPYATDMYPGAIRIYENAISYILPANLASRMYSWKA